MNSIAAHKLLVSPQNDKAMTENQNTKLQVTPTVIPDVLIVEPKVFGDNRGWFTESFNAHDFAKAIALNVEFVQDNHSFSREWTLRGLHYQLKHTQGKLVRVTAGSVFDVAVDLRKDSATFGKWFFRYRRRDGYQYDAAQLKRSY
jgi:dTDP-4-dehydrorhamnose 3,5-epimerase